MAEASRTMAIRAGSNGSTSGTLKEVDFLKATSEENAGQIIMTCTKLIADDAGEEESVQLCSYLLTIISSVFRDVEEAAKNALRQLGATYTIRILPRDCGVTAIQLELSADIGICLLVFAQAVLILLKNISTNRYDNFIRNRINAMRALIGVDPRIGELRAFDYDKANLFHTRVTRVGACLDFRIAIVNSILYEARYTDNLGKICSYLTTILAWTDMSSLTFIADSLLYNKSPVLYDERVANEVLALAEAFTAVYQSTYPQFFGIMRSPLECKILERNRFPILFAVACTIRARTHPSVGNFVVPRQNMSIVNELVALHTDSRRSIPNAVTRMIEYLTDFTDNNYGPIIEDITEQQSTPQIGAEAGRSIPNAVTRMVEYLSDFTDDNYGPINRRHHRAAVYTTDRD